MSELTKHALMLDGLATLYENEAMIGPRHRSMQSQISADACKAGADALRTLIGSGTQDASAERADATRRSASAEDTRSLSQAPPKEVA